MISAALRPGFSPAQTISGPFGNRPVVSFRLQAETAPRPPAQVVVAYDGGDVEDIVARRRENPRLNERRWSLVIRFDRRSPFRVVEVQQGRRHRAGIDDVRSQMGGVDRRKRKHLWIGSLNSDRVLTRMIPYSCRSTSP